LTENQSTTAIIRTKIIVQCWNINCLPLHFSTGGPKAKAVAEKYARHKTTDIKKMRIFHNLPPQSLFEVD